jgi:hypothetical protein
MDQVIYLVSLASCSTLYLFLEIQLSPDKSGPLGIKTFDRFRARLGLFFLLHFYQLVGQLLGNLEFPRPFLGDFKENPSPKLLSFGLH